MMAAACGANEQSEAVPTLNDADANDPVENGPSAEVDAPASNGTDIDWQGHRGARGLRPENTLPAFELALDLTVDTLEFDLHLSADNEVVVWHDPIVDESKCEGDGVGRPIRELSSTQLRALRCAGNPDPAAFDEQTAEPGALSGDDFGIVTLPELLRFVDSYATADSKTDDQRTAAAGVGFNMETKRRPDDPAAIGDGFDGTTMGLFEEATVEAVTDAGMVGRATIQSFDHRSLWAIHARHPEIRLAALTRRDDRPDLAGLAGQGASVWSPDHRTLSSELVGLAHEVGLDVIPWTVNDVADMERLIKLGVDGIITDRPDLRPATNG